MLLVRFPGFHIGNPCVISSDTRPKTGKLVGRRDTALINLSNARRIACATLLGAQQLSLRRGGHDRDHWDS